MSPLLPLALLGSSVLPPTHVAVYFLETVPEFIGSLPSCWGRGASRECGGDREGRGQGYLFTQHCLNIFPAAELFGAVDFTGNKIV